MKKKDRRKQLIAKRKQQRENYANKNLPNLQKIIQNGEEKELALSREMSQEFVKVENKESKQEIKPMETKSFLKSKTFWVSIIEIVIAILLALKDELLTGGVLGGAGIIQIILRIVTNKAISLTSK